MNDPSNRVHTSDGAGGGVLDPALPQDLGELGGAHHILERVRAAKKAEFTTYPDSTCSVAVSLGGSYRHSGYETARALLQSVDETVYSTKHSGRGPVQLALDLGQRRDVA